jgi:putative toxin-antitoxin system antitoxin component (TIGR02293 family)
MWIPRSEIVNILEIMKYLGGAAVFGRVPQNSLELEAQLRQGLPIRSFMAFKAWARLSNDELASIADISPKTLQRYFKLSQTKKTPAKALRVAVSPSDRVFRAAELIALATTVFGGDEDAAHEWLRSEQFGLGGKVPLDLLRTGLGAQLVENELKRIQHGFLA